MKVIRVEAGDKSFEIFYNKEKVKHGTDIYENIEEEEKCIEEAKIKVEELLFWYQKNKEVLDNEKEKMYYYHLARVFDKNLIKSNYEEKE